MALKGCDLVKVVCGVERNMLSFTGGDDNVLIQGNFCGGGVPGDEPIPKQRTQRLRAKLNGLENAG